jgi:hypothetical protein
MQKKLYDNQNRLRCVLDETDTRITLRSNTMSLLGHYDKHYDKTYDNQGRFVGQGNQLMILV